MSPNDLRLRALLSDYTFCRCAGDSLTKSELFQSARSLGFDSCFSCGDNFEFRHRNGERFVVDIVHNSEGGVGFRLIGNPAQHFYPFDTSPTATPPRSVEKLLSFLIPPDRVEEIIGDFDEGYRLMLERHGAVHAYWWYRWQVLMVAVRGLFDAACRAAKIWSGFGPA